MSRRHLALAVALLLPLTARASPPPAGSEDFAILMPFKHWIASQAKPGQFGDKQYCCNISDGRLVEVRTVDNHYEVRPLHPETLNNPPHGWVRVPAEAVLRAPNPIGHPVAWFAGDSVECFAPAGGI
jgi:hypothetical protein